LRGQSAAAVCLTTLRREPNVCHAIDSYGRTPLHDAVTAILQGTAKYCWEPPEDEKALMIHTAVTADNGQSSELYEDYALTTMVDTSSMPALISMPKTSPDVPL
jgi:hypothetical protein